MSRDHDAAQPRVLQANFQGRPPTFAVQAFAPTPATRHVAPHVQAALSHHVPHGHGAHGAGSPAAAAQCERRGNAFRVPPSLDLAHPGPGRPLPDAMRQKMEALFKTDFSAVRVHVGIQAKALGAAAFTMGSQIHFAPGHDDLHTPRGQRLLGHELAHVVQQRSGRVRNPFGGGVAVVQDPGLEADAERMGCWRSRRGGRAGTSQAASRPTPSGTTTPSATCSAFNAWKRRNGRPKTTTTTWS